MTTIISPSDLDGLTPDLQAVSLIMRELAETSQTLVFDQDKEKNVKVLTTNDFPKLMHTLVERLELDGYTPEMYYTDTDTFTKALRRYGQLEASIEQMNEDQLHRQQATGYEAIRLVKKIIASPDKFSEADFLTEILRLSYQAGASDLHFQTESSAIIMRLRKDGLMQTIATFTHEYRNKYLMKMKFMAGIKMNVSTTSQDGRFSFHARKGKDRIKIDVRVSVMPGLRGESIVLRFLDATKGLMTFDKIGLSAQHIELLHTHMKRHSGLILVTGPTGSGKTTTVYSIISQLNDPDIKIITLEDPVEYELPGIEQSQINEAKGYTFEQGLKGVLRHDPDIIMVGEIRTLAAAEMAINAALTGHLVISTLHTNSAIESISRLVNMGVNPYMLASALNLVIGQRLMRKLDSKKTLEDVNPADDSYIQTQLTQIKKQANYLDLNYEKRLYIPKNNRKTQGNGYEGRIAAMEILEVDETLTKAIMEDNTSYEIQEKALQQGYLTLEQDALIKVIHGKTSLEEMRRGIGE